MGSPVRDRSIWWHTTGHADMTLLEKIIYLADYIEPSRDFLRPVTDIGTSQDFCTGRYFTISSNTDVMTDNSAFIDKCPLPYTYITSNSCPRKNHNTWFDSIVIPAHKGFLGDKSGQYSSKTGNLSCQYLSTLSTSDTNNNLTVCFQTHNAETKILPLVDLVSAV